MSVEGQDERKIEEYLDKQGITSMQDVGIKKVVSSNFNQMNCHIYLVIRQGFCLPKQPQKSVPEVIKILPCSSQLSMKF